MRRLGMALVGFVDVIGVAVHIVHNTTPNHKQIVSALRMVGYDHVMSIEHEDALTSIDEGITAAVDLLSRVILTEPPVDPWWT